MDYLVIAIGIISSIHQIRCLSAGERNKFKRLYFLFFSVVFTLMGVFMVSYRNDILFFAPKSEARNVIIELDETVEDTSVIIFFNEFIHSEMKSYDAEVLLGDGYSEMEDSGSYLMRYYRVTQYTLNNISSDGIFFGFNKKGEKGKLRGVTWTHDTLGTDEALFYELVDYLTPLLGEPIKIKTSSSGYISAQWVGYNLECTNTRISFRRDFN